MIGGGMGHAAIGHSGRGQRLFSGRVFACAAVFEKAAQEGAVFSALRLAAAVWDKYITCTVKR